MNIHYLNKSTYQKLPIIVADFLGFKNITRQQSLNDIVAYYNAFYIHSMASAGFRIDATNKPKIHFISDSIFVYIDALAAINENAPIIYIKWMINYLSKLIYNSISGFDRGGNFPKVPGSVDDIIMG